MPVTSPSSTSTFCCAAQDRRGSATRSPPATGRRSRPGRAAAGRDDSCAGRSTVIRRRPRRASACAALSPPKPAPTMTTCSVIGSAPLRAAMIRNFSRAGRYRREDQAMQNRHIRCRPLSGRLAARGSLEIEHAPDARRRIAMAVLAAGLAPGTVAVAAEPMNCRVEEPDSVQISWIRPARPATGSSIPSWAAAHGTGIPLPMTARPGPAPAGRARSRATAWSSGSNMARRSTASRGPSSRGGVRATGSTAGTRPIGSRAPTRTISRRSRDGAYCRRDLTGLWHHGCFVQIAGSSPSAWRARHVTIRRRIQRSAVQLAFRVRSGARRSSSLTAS